MNEEDTEEVDPKVTQFLLQMAWYAGRIYGTDIDTRKEVVADAALTTEGNWYADTDIWAGPDADAGTDAESTTGVPVPERFSASTSNDTTPVSFRKLPCW